MTTWQGVEFAVCEIYLAFFATSMRDAPTVAYHAIRTFDARTQMVDALVKHFCPERYQEWQRIKKRTNDTRRVRNIAAHGMPTFIGKAPNRKWVMGESPHNIKKFKKSCQLNDYTSSKEMKESMVAMVRATKELVSFRVSLEEDKTLQTKLLLHQTNDLENCRGTKLTVRERETP